MENASKETEQEKERIRNRYKGISPDLLEVIPAVEHVDLLQDTSEKQVGVYVRVSTDSKNQTSSFELQKNHYTDLVDRYPNWHLYRIYPDEGISGTSLKHRKAFLEMIQDCKQHKLDLIITKSVSRFARNIYDCIGYVRELAALKPPVGVYFETEGIYTLRDNSEMALSFTATIAQEESRTKSSSMNLSYEMRFRRGIFMLPKPLGFDKDEDGNLIINEDEALTVRLIFFMFLYGYPLQEIADTLTELKRTTKKGNTVWTVSSVLSILQNERHCGDVLAHKTWTPNYLDHKSAKNYGDKPQYRQRDHHEAIISHDDFIAAQQLIAHSVTGRTGMLPHLRVIDHGALKGFVIVNPRWTGFNLTDYMRAAESVREREATEARDAPTLQPESGDLDLRGYAVVRSQFVGSSRNYFSIHLSNEYLWFNKHCLGVFPEHRYIEFLFDPIRSLLAVRRSQKDEKNMMDWCYYDGKTYKTRKMIGRAFLPVFYQCMNWVAEREYIVQGECFDNGEESFLVFDFKDAEVIINKPTKDSTVADQNKEAAKDETIRQIAMPSSWITSFGSDYYSEELIPQIREKEWNTQDKGTPLPRNDPFKATGKRELHTRSTGSTVS